MRRVLYNHDRARHSGPKQELYQRLEEENICLFCKDGRAFGDVQLVRKGVYWDVVRNKFPQEGVVAQYVGIYYEHITNAIEAKPEAWGELIKLFREVVGDDNFSVTIRNGDMRYTCATVAHLHAQCFVGVSGSYGDETIIVDVGYKQK